MKTCNLADQKVVFGTKKAFFNLRFSPKIIILSYSIIILNVSVILGHKIDFQGQQNSNIPASLGSVTVKIQQNFENYEFFNDLFYYVLTFR